MMESKEMTLKFEISDKELKKIPKNCKSCKHFKYDFKFINTGLRVIVLAICNKCKAEYNITDFDCW